MLYEDSTPGNNGEHAGGHSNIITEPSDRQSFLDNALVPILQHPVEGTQYTIGTHPIVLGWDIINEPEWGIGLLGDKARSVVFDNSKIKSIVKGWQAKVSFEEGIRESIEWYESKPERMIPDPGIEEKTNNLINKFLKA